MTSRPPATATPIHPRLLELAGSNSHASDSPFSTPGSAINASSYDQTGDTPKSVMTEGNDSHTNNDSSGESLGIRARRPGSSGFIDAQESPQGTSTSDSSKTTEVDGQSSEIHACQKSHADSGSNTALPAETGAVHVAQSVPVLPADQPHLHRDRHDGEAGQRASSASSHSRITSITKESYFISGLNGRASAFYSPPPPFQGASSLKRGDYYSTAADAATANIPSPKLEPIPEASSEISGRYRAAMMAETPLKHAPGRGQNAALAARRPTPYAASLLQDILDTSKSFTDSSTKLSTPNSRFGSSFNDSMFESPLLAPMAPYGSPIRFNTMNNLLAQSGDQAPHSVEKSPVSIPLSKRLTIKRPPGFDVPSPLKREEAKIKDILWKSPAQDEEDAADVDILPPELEQLGPPSPYAAQFDKNLADEPNNETKDSSDAAGVPAQKPPVLKRLNSQSGPDGNLNKIPTLVGPNSLPYARCPSGVDSFAFDLHNPRPYDVVMPITKDSSIPKSISCDDKLFYRASRDGPTADEKAEEPCQPIPQGQPINKAHTADPAELPYQPMHRTTSGNSTHNERARQRMERVKMATMKREQARMEEQNRREVARITRKLAAEQEQRKEAMMFDNATRNGQLNSAATPFMPRSPHLPSSAHEPLNIHNAFPLQSASLQGQAYNQGTLPYNQGTLHGLGQNSTFDNIAEASQTQNRLLQILQQRMQGMSLAPEVHTGIQHTQPYNANTLAQAQSLPVIQGSGVLSAINTMMQTNQQLISMLQETERMLAGNGASAAALRSIPPGLEHMISHGDRPAFTYANASGPLCPSQDYQFPAYPNNGYPLEDRVMSEPNFRPNLSASNDPAVVHLQRRKSVTFDEASINLAEMRGNVSAPDVPRARPVKQLPMLARSVHELPPRPSDIEVSHKLLGILPLDATAPYQPASTPVGLPVLNSTILADSTSTITASEADQRRQNRSNAPSPECFTAPVKSVTGRQGSVTSLAPIAARQKAYQPKQRDVVVNKPQRQPMADKSANISASSISSGKNALARRSSPDKENKDTRKTGTVKATDQRKSGKSVAKKRIEPDDPKWTSFVRQMGGVAVTSSAK